MLADVDARHVVLLQEYLRTCSRRSGIPIALNGDLVILNEQAQTLLDPTDQAALLAHGTEAMSHAQHGTLAVELSSCSAARMHCRSMHPSDVSAGVVIHVKLDQLDVQHDLGREATHRVPLPGLVRTSSSWLHACQEVETAFRAGEWLAVQGEAGVGSR